MRLLIEIFVISALIYLGWDTPFKQWGDRATAAIQKLLPSKKRQTPSGVIMIVAATAPWETGAESPGRTGARKPSPAR
jgi:hypothetical protein